jgi:hypothetical protein
VLGHGQKGAPVAGGNSPGTDDGGGVFGRSHGDVIDALSESIE